MSTTPSIDAHHAIYDEHDRYISERRAELLTALTTTLNAMNRAAAILTELRSDAIYDVELAEGPAGNDAASFLADSTRNIRATYAIVHHIIATDTA